MVWFPCTLGEIVRGWGISKSSRGWYMASRGSGWHPDYHCKGDVNHVHGQITLLWYLIQWSSHRYQAKGSGFKGQDMPWYRQRCWLKAEIRPVSYCGVQTYPSLYLFNMWITPIEVISSQDSQQEQHYFSMLHCPWANIMTPHGGLLNFWELASLNLDCYWSLKKVCLEKEHQVLAEQNHEKDANTCFQCLNILHRGRYCTCVMMYIVFWTTKTARAHPLPAQSLVHAVKGWNVVEFPGHRLNQYVSTWVPGAGEPQSTLALSFPLVMLLAVLPGACMHSEPVKFAIPLFSSAPEFKPEKVAFLSSPFFPNCCREEWVNSSFFDILFYCTCISKSLSLPLLYRNRCLTLAVSPAMRAEASSQC